MSQGVKVKKILARGYPSRVLNRLTIFTTFSSSFARTLFAGIGWPRTSATCGACVPKWKKKVFSTKSPWECETVALVVFATLFGNVSALSDVGLFVMIFVLYCRQERDEVAPQRVWFRLVHGSCLMTIVGCVRCRRAPAILCFRIPSDRARLHSIHISSLCRN